MPPMSYFGKTRFSSYLSGGPGTGCAGGCMMHLTLLGLFLLALLIWAVVNRAWELEVTVEMPASMVEEVDKPADDRRKP